MQVNLNPQQNKQNFGMAIHSNENVNKLLMTRIKNSIQLNELQEIISKQKLNDLVDINLFVNPDGKTLSGNLFSKDTEKYLFKPYVENTFNYLFGSPVKFIKKLAKSAEKEAAKLKTSDLNYDDVFNKMK